MYRNWFAVAAVSSATLLTVGYAFEKAIPVVAPRIPLQFENNPELYRAWPGWTETYMWIHPLVYGIPFALVYVAVRSVVGAGWRSGLKYGLAVFAVGALPVWLLMSASVRVSPEVMASFLLRSVCQYAAAGAAAGAYWRWATSSPSP